MLDDVSSPSRVQPLLPGHAGCAVLLTTRSEDVAAALGASVQRLPELSQASSIDLLARLAGQARLDAADAILSVWTSSNAMKYTSRCEVELLMSKIPLKR